MKAALRVLTPLFVSLFAAAGAFAQCNPGANQVAFFVDDQYRGRCVVLGFGDYPTASSIGLPNDSITSIRLGAGTQVYMCRDHYFQGTCELLKLSDPNLGNNAIGNDQITSVRVQPLGASTACIPAANQVAFFIDANYSGGCQVRGLGAYANAAAIGLPNDSISSFRLGASAQVIACRDVNYGGNCERFTSDVANMGSTAIGNDRISSARVETKGFQDCQPGNQQAAFFMHSNFVAPCSVHGVGEYANSTALGVPNDSISSILIGPGAQTEVCVDVNFGGDCQRFTANQANLGTTRVGNDKISSARVQMAGQADCTAGQGQVAFFANDDMVGPCSVRGVGEYPTPQAIGIANDSMSSIAVGSGAQVVLCVDNNYGGNCEKFTASDPHLGDNPIRNDRVSSARVQPLGTQDCPPGPNQVAVYQHGDFLAPCAVKGIGDYPNAAATGLPDNSISSIRLNGAVQLCGCDGENFTTQCKTFSADTANLGGSFNDVISSMRVQAPGAQCQAVTQPPVTVKTVLVYNCHQDQRSVYIWTYDGSTAAYANKGSAPSNWSNGSCPVGQPFSLTLTAGHQMEVIAVDPEGPTCGGQNDPSVIGCQKLVSPFMLGGDNGQTVTLQVQ